MNIAAFLVAVATFASAGELMPLTGNAQSAPPKPLAYRIFADIVASKGCVEQTTFAPGDHIAWRAEIDDAAGVKLTAAQVKVLGITAVVKLKDGTTLPLRLNVHPPFPDAKVTDMYWSVSYAIKPDHPTGTMPWTFVVSDAAGNVVTFAPIGQSVGASVLTIAEKGAAAPPNS
jgi:hypothetical protein